MAEGCVVDVQFCSRSSFLRLLYTQLARTLSVRSWRSSRTPAPPHPALPTRLRRRATCLLPIPACKTAYLSLVLLDMPGPGSASFDKCAGTVALPPKPGLPRTLYLPSLTPAPTQDKARTMVARYDPFAF